MKWSGCLLLVTLGIQLAACSRNPGSDPSSAPPASSADLGEAVTEDGLFSYQGPKGWQPQDDPARDYAICVGPVEEKGFRPMIVVTSEGNQSVDDYVKAEVSKLSAPDAKARLIDQRSFETNHGVSGVKLVVGIETPRRKIEALRYIFTAKNGLLLVFRCQCLAAEDAQFQPIFDASIKSLTLDSN